MIVRNTRRTVKHLYQALMSDHRDYNDIFLVNYTYSHNDHPVISINLKNKLSKKVDKICNADIHFYPISFESGVCKHYYINVIITLSSSKIVDDMPTYSLDDLMYYSGNIFLSTNNSKVYTNIIEPICDMLANKLVVNIPFLDYSIPLLSLIREPISSITPYGIRHAVRRRIERCYALRYDLYPGGKEFIDNYIKGLSAWQLAKQFVELGYEVKLDYNLKRQDVFVIKNTFRRLYITLLGTDYINHYQYQVSHDLEGRDNKVYDVFGTNCITKVNSIVSRIQRDYNL